MKFALVTVALIVSTSAFGAVETSPPTELPGCELVDTVKSGVSHPFEMECR